MIDEMSFVAMPKITHVLFMRYIGLRQQDDVRSHDLEKVPQKFDDLVALRQMKAVCSDLLPEEGDGIQAKNPTALGKIKHDEVEKLEQQIGGTPVQIYLIGTERRPDMALARPSCRRGQER